MDTNPRRDVEEEPSSISLELVRVGELKLFSDSLCLILRSPHTPRKKRQALERTFPTPSDTLKALIEAVCVNRNASPLRSLLRIVSNRYNCFAVSEFPYFDLDEWGGYAAFYARSFMPYSRLCRRIHFFEGEDAGGQRLIQLLQEGAGQTEIDSFMSGDPLQYRGFSLLRPTRNHVLGRTAVFFDTRGPGESVGVQRHPLENTGRPYCTTNMWNTAHLLNVRFDLSAPPFIQQNPAIGACATASLWTASLVPCQP